MRKVILLATRSGRAVSAGRPIAGAADFSPAVQAEQNIDLPAIAPFFLEDRLAPILETVCAKQMRWFGRACLFFQRVSPSFSPERVWGSHIGELIFLFLSIPCFKLSHFFFKITYLLQHRRLSRLGRYCARLGGQDFSLEFPDLSSEDRSVLGIYQRLRDIKSRLQRSESGGEISNIRHGRSVPFAEEIKRPFGQLPAAPATGASRTIPSPAPAPPASASVSVPR
jgi:hypothetical protein